MKELKEQGDEMKRRQADLKNKEIDFKVNKEEELRRLRNSNRELNREKDELNNRIDSLIGELDSLTEHNKLIPKLEKDKATMQETITELEVKLNLANNQKNSLLEAVENEEGIDELRKQVAQISTMFLQPDFVLNMSDKAKTSFKEVFGKQVFDTIS